MAYFPLFVELQGRRALIVGGGRLALHKAEKLLPYGAELRAVAPEFCPELQALPGVELRRGSFEPRDLDGVFLAIAATDDRDVNSAVASACRERGIPVNVVDELSECGFVFPARSPRALPRPDAAPAPPPGRGTGWTRLCRKVSRTFSPSSAPCARR